ncbi:MAG: Flagellar basal-body rod protein FlgC [Phycisphaerae bacterium]|nr:Flagellar basal-body rod protein FlgC [Phycisphaerae bacterium]
MFGALDISTSALVAQRIRMDTIAGNMANAQTLIGEDKAYQRRVPIFAIGASSENPEQPGVHVAEIMLDPRPGELVYDPNHPLAIRNGPNQGFVRQPNVNELEEMINAMEAARAYEANITVMNGTRAMLNSAMKLIA